MTTWKLVVGAMKFSGHWMKTILTLFPLSTRQQVHSWFTVTWKKKNTRSPVLPNRNYIVYNMLMIYLHITNWRYKKEIKDVAFSGRWTEKCVILQQAQQKPCVLTNFDTITMFKDALSNLKCYRSDSLNVTDCVWSWAFDSYSMGFHCKKYQLQGKKSYRTVKVFKRWYSYDTLKSVISVTHLHNFKE
jgi:hypothetical protein